MNRYLPTSDPASIIPSNTDDQPQSERISTLLDAAKWLQWSHSEQSATLYGKAALLGSTEAMIEFGTQIQDYDPDLASHWFEQAAASGNYDAYGYHIELWAEKDQPRATELVDQILATENAEAIYSSAQQLEEVNINTAIRLFQKATDLGHDNAPHELGKLLLRKTTKNKGETLHLFELAVERGCSSAALDLAKMIENEDPSRAAELYERALHGLADGCKQPEAAARLARLVKDKDPKRALALFDEVWQSTSIEAKNDYANEIDSIDPRAAKMLYEDARSIEEEELSFDYCGIPRKRSGLPVNLLASDAGSLKNGKYNPPHILVANNGDERILILGGDSFKASISKNPHVLEGENKLNEEDWADVRAFIADNYDALIHHWIHADEQGSWELYEMLFPDNYENARERRSRVTDDALQLLDVDDSLEKLIDSMWRELNEQD